MEAAATLTHGDLGATGPAAGSVRSAMPACAVVLRGWQGYPKAVIGSRGAWAVAAVLAVPNSAAAARPSPKVRSVQAEPAAVDTLRPADTERCRQLVPQELRQGRRLEGGCRDERDLAARKLVRRRDSFGFIERQQVELSSLRLVLGLAKRCRRWPLRTGGRDFLRRPDVHAAGCRPRRYEGEVSLNFIDADGNRHTPLPPISTDRDGRLTLHFASVDSALRAVGGGGLDDYARIELGDDGWAGHVDLERLLGFRADWHFVWVRRGRGIPALFAARHPDHPGTEDALNLAADAQLARQELDLERVEAQQLSPQTFIDRHPWSPFRDVVEALQWPDALVRKPERDPRLPRPLGTAGAPNDASDRARADAEARAEAEARTVR